MRSRHLFISKTLQSIQSWRLQGSICPSSIHLSKTMASQVLGFERVIELGAGTGPLTEILMSIYRPHQLLINDIEPRWIDCLKTQFPSIEQSLHLGDAADFLMDDLTQFQGGKKMPRTAIVSSLPFRSLSENHRGQIENALMQWMAFHFQKTGDNGVYQYTYHPWDPPFDLDPNSHWSWELQARVWRNIPPACVWRLQYRK